MRKFSLSPEPKEFTVKYHRGCTVWGVTRRTSYEARSLPGAITALPWCSVYPSLPTTRNAERYESNASSSQQLYQTIRIHCTSSLMQSCTASQSPTSQSGQDPENPFSSAFGILSFPQILMQSLFSGSNSAVQPGKSTARINSRQTYLVY